MLRGVTVLSEEEIRIALELVDAALKGDESYRFVLGCRPDGRLAAYACYGRVPFTDATYDLYWIVVDPADQGTGVGRRLLREVERAVRGLGGRMLLIDTGSKEELAPARALYAAEGFREEARIVDFYGAGNHRITYGKRLR
jgi:ribosomal protein S18 acetylase RimI-like enzyme